MILSADLGNNLGDKMILASGKAQKLGSALIGGSEVIHFPFLTRFVSFLVVTRLIYYNITAIKVILFIKVELIIFFYGTPFFFFDGTLIFLCDYFI